MRTFVSANGDKAPRSSIGPRCPTALDCGFNRWMQHLDSHRRGRDVAYEVPDEDPVHRDRQGLDVGEGAARRRLVAGAGFVRYLHGSQGAAKRRSRGPGGQSGRPLSTYSVEKLLNEAALSRS